MHSNLPRKRSQARHRERGATSVEYVGLVVALAVLVAGMAQQFSGRPAGAIAAAIPQRIAAALEHEGSTHTAKERRTSGGTLPARVGRDDLRLDPVVPTVGVRRGDLDRAYRVAGFDIRLTGEACAVCIRVGERHSLAAGATRDANTSGPGGQGSVSVDARFALLAAELGARVERSIGFGFGGPTKVGLQARLRGIVGGELEGSAKLVATRAEQRLDVGGSAMAGAAGKAEARAGLDLFGISLQQTGRAEGWAGAGARGRISVERRGARLSWETGWGAALGLGGAVGWSGTIDLSGLQQTRDEARSMLADALGAVQLPDFVHHPAHSLDLQELLR
ncbi:MAG: hypothetical protein JWN72_653 [Thermoleophilia bacterium]|nr:hypothetical protein [Thermoleophilia bacterium]